MMQGRSPSHLHAPQTEKDRAVLSRASPETETCITWALETGTTLTDHPCPSHPLEQESVSCRVLKTGEFPSQVKWRTGYGVER